MSSQTCQPSQDLHGRFRGAGGERTGVSYVWLAYSVFFFIEPYARNDRRFWLQSIATFVVFLALYTTYVELPRRPLRLSIVAVFCLMGFAVLPHNPGASCFFIFAVALMPFLIESTPWFVAAMLAEVFGLCAEGYLLKLPPYSYIFTTVFVLVVGTTNLFGAQQKRADSRLRRAQAENLALAGVAERERIARDLHDVLGHTLSVIVLKAELAGRLMGRDNDRAALEIADVERTARTALAEVREAIGGYRAKGLSAELDQARLTLDAAGVVLTCDSRPPAFRAREETVLSLAVREAVTNIVRHAHATECHVHFTTTPDGYASLVVEDNGSTKIAREGNGLRGMRERVQEIGGRFRIEAEPATRIIIELPS